MKGILRIALAAAVVFGLVQSRFASASPLEGKSFVGEMGEKGKTKGDKDTFVFKEGRFRSTATGTASATPPTRSRRTPARWSSPRRRRARSKAR